MSEEDVVKKRFPHAAATTIPFAPPGVADESSGLACWVVTSDVVTSGEESENATLGYGKTAEAAWANAAYNLNARYWYRGKAPAKVRRAAYCGVGLLALTFVVACFAWFTKRPHDMLPVLYLLAFFWVLMPSLWFWYEYHFMIVEKVTNDQLDRYKYGVQLGAAIWAAIAVSLLAYASNEHFKAKDESPKQKDVPTELNVKAELSIKKSESSPQQKDNPAALNIKKPNEPAVPTPN